jgi:hypothetical protein
MSWSLLAAALTALPSLVSDACTSTVASPVRPDDEEDEGLDAEDEEADEGESPRERRRRLRRDRLERRLDREIEREERQAELRERADSDRRLLATLGAGATLIVVVDGGLLAGLEAALGLRKQFATRFALQGRITIGGGGVGDDGPGGDGTAFESAAVTTSADVTIRVGFGGKLYLGLGTFARLFHAFAGAGDAISTGIGQIQVRDPSFTSILGGAALELGWLLGQERRADLGLRGVGGLVLHSFSGEDGVELTGDHPAFFFGLTVGFSWGLGGG